MASEFTTPSDGGLSERPSEKRRDHFSGYEHSLESGDTGFDESETKRLIRKIDLNVIPILALLYLLSFLDRTNVGNARLAGLEEDLHMKGLDYNVALAVFFPWYVASEIPSNIMLKKFSPKLWLSFIMVVWGTIMTLMGTVTSYGGLLAARMALGIAEGGLFPGINFIITMWYRRHECAFRMAIFFSAATLAGAFGGLLARAIMPMSGVGGKHGWAWIFILEGLATVIIAGLAFFFIKEYPDSAKFLTPAEKLEVQRRLKLDRSSLADEFHMKYFFQALKDWKIYVHMLITIGVYTPLYSFSLFLPTIIKNMGFEENPNHAQLMTVPPYVCACVVTITAGYIADKAKQRGIFMIFFCLLSIAGFSMLISTKNPHVQYAGTFFAAMGIYPNVAMGVAWNGNNIGGSTKRGVGIGMHTSFGNLGGIISGFSYQSKDGPRFFRGHGLLIAFQTMSLCLSAVMTIWLRRENARRDKLAAERGLRPEDYTDEQKEAERELGDDASFFRYTI